ncbi:hypothetical protein PIB30_075536 [Stylosanthes scabra]|uniref:Uncharacterized protein n=1 Tax=Stylosanthes scabra TaxID=79078 RepID=A0ABU6UPH2_9FABA|nr:hypothetical protein [Stylosanthes scabra]
MREAESDLNGGASLKKKKNEMVPPTTEGHGDLVNSSGMKHEPSPLISDNLNGGDKKKMSTLFWERLGYKAIGVVEAKGHKDGIWILASREYSISCGFVDISDQCVILVNPESAVDRNDAIA